jgi:hypothetical protein
MFDHVYNGKNKAVAVTLKTLIHSKYTSRSSPSVMSGGALSSLYTMSCHPLAQDAKSISLLKSCGWSGKL